ncbi:hypothetical protein O0L34_g17315 [Tuta absoluta]|nr:hypothetical protein O0L34_g17315 [Tuta absoluta]
MNNISYNPKFGYLRNCSKLRDLWIFETGIKQTHMILKDASEVKKLEIRGLSVNCFIEQFLLFSNRYSFNNLESIYLAEIGNNCSLNINNWIEISATVTSQLSMLPKLQKLHIKDFPVYDMCAPSMLPVVFKSLTYLALISTNTTEVCFAKYHAMPKLQELKIKGSPFINIEFTELITSPSPNLSVEVDSVRSLKFSRNEYLALASGANKGQIIIDRLQLLMDCSCDNEATLWLMRAMAEDLVVAEDLVCSDDGKPLGNQTCDRLDCNRPACKLSTCVCCRLGTHESVAAVCRNANLTTLPDEILGLRNLTQLIVANNRISSFPEKLPETLLRLDLSDNKIQHLDDGETKVLFDVSARKLRLAGNPIVCNMESCYNQPLLDALQLPNNQVEDNAECIGEARILSSLPEFCELKFSTKREITLILAVVLIIILAAIALLALYYRQSLKMYLFAHGWCLWWLREEEMDEDRCYDVFLSFCHADIQLVLDQLLPELDRDFSVCVHLRDWVPGEMIPVQILQSVEQSRRTVVVVSNNYAKSLWGLLEFRTAYASGLSEGRCRVVMVVLDDVLESRDLNGELKQYIRLHTYVRWGDPWFWSKLRYALPHNPRQNAQMQEPVVPESIPQLLVLDVEPSLTEN